jgi:two-component system nitrate/nitrite response regulator NarL
MSGRVAYLPTDEERPIRVFVIAAHVVVREGLKAVLRSDGHLDLAGEASDGLDLPALVAKSASDVVIFDPDSHGADGADLIARLVRTAPTAKLLVLTGVRDVMRDQAALRGGARGVVLKNAPMEILIKAIRRVHGGELWFERRVIASALIPQPIPRPVDTQGGTTTLTERERQIVMLIGEGLRNCQIAERMGIAEKTVRNQLLSVFDKLGVADRLALAIYAYQHGLAHVPG